MIRQLIFCRACGVIRALVAGVGLEPTQRPEGSSAYETDEHAAAPPRYVCQGKASNPAPSGRGATSAGMFLPVEPLSTRVEEFVAGRNRTAPLPREERAFYH